MIVTTSPRRWSSIRASSGSQRFAEAFSASRCGRNRPRPGQPAVHQVRKAVRTAGIADEHPGVRMIWLAAHGFPLSQIMSPVYPLRQRHATRKLPIFRGQPICRGFRINATYRVAGVPPYASEEGDRLFR